MTEAELEEIRGRHPVEGHACPNCDEYCCACGRYHTPEKCKYAPCDLAKLLSEIERLRGVVEAIDPAKLLEVASWFDLVDELLDVCFVKETAEGAILLAGSGDLTPLRARLKGPRDEIQSDLRRWSAALAALEEGE